MIAIRTSKNSYKFINTDKIKIKAFNITTIALALYGFVTLVTK